MQSFLLNQTYLCDKQPQKETIFCWMICIWMHHLWVRLLCQSTWLQSELTNWPAAVITYTLMWSGACLCLLFLKKVATGPWVYKPFFFFHSGFFRFLSNFNKMLNKLGKTQSGASRVECVCWVEAAIETWQIQAALRWSSPGYLMCLRVEKKWHKQVV